MKTNQPTPQMKHRTVQAAHFKVLDETDGIAEMIVNVFNTVDYAEERTIPGCCAKSIARKFPKGVWMHDWTQPVAKTLECEELLPGDERLPEKIRDLGGLYVKGQFNLATTRGKDAFEDLRFGTVDEFSIGYYEVRVKRAKDGVLDLLEIDLVEWSPVLVGCNPETILIGVKSDNRQAGALRPASSPTSSSRKDVMSKHQTKAPEDGRVHIKSQYLGYYAEADASVSAISTLMNRLMYWAVYDALYYDSDEGESVDEQITELLAAFDECRDISVAIVRAIMEAGQASMEAAQKSVQELFADPDATVPETAAFQKQVTATTLALKTCVERGTVLLEGRVKQGLSLSEERVEELTTLRNSLDGLITHAKRADPDEVAKAKVKLLMRNQKRRELLLGIAPAPAASE